VHFHAGQAASARKINRPVFVRFAGQRCGVKIPPGPDTRQNGQPHQQNDLFDESTIAQANAAADDGEPGKKNTQTQPGQQNRHRVVEQ
jgi:hypothetical protein